MHDTAVRAHCRWTIRRDMPEILAIENKCFDNAWNEKDFCLFLRGRTNIGMVAEVGGKVVGYMMYEIHPTRLGLANFAVDPAYQRTGVGRQMVKKLVSKLSSHSRSRITLDVRETNLPAQLFFRSQGFRATHIRPGFYLDSGEDAYRMVYTLTCDETE